MSVLDQRRARILRLMGVSIWELRDSEDDKSTTNSLVDSGIEKISDELEAKEILDTEQFASLEDIAAAVRECQRCPLSSNRKFAVPGAGNPEAKWMFVGEAPGRDENLQGLPFVGRAGQLLNSMIAALGLSRDQVFITNTVKCRPPNNRDPESQEVNECKPYLEAQIGMIQPHVMVALGRISARLLLKTAEKVSMSELRGKVHAYDGTGIPLIVTYHPAYLLRSPDQKRVAWQDLLLARSQLKSPQS